MELSKIRKQIDKLDKKLVLILAKRMNLISKIAKYKKENNIPIYQPKREKELLKEKIKLAEELNLNPRLVDDLFK